MTDDDSESNAAPALIWLGLFCLLLLSLALDFRNFQHGGSIDLRSRIVGARLMLEGRDPYHYKWKLPEPAAFCDPFNNAAVPVSTTTVTPAMVLLHAPLAPLPYRSARLLWLLLQWSALAGAAVLWIRAAESSRDRLLLAAVFVCFTFTAAWRLHAERGQSYVILLLLVAGWAQASLRESGWRSLLAGVLAGVLIALRPPLAVVVLPFVGLCRRRQLPGLALGLLGAAGLPMVFQPDCWKQYAGAMEEWAQLYRTTAPRPPGQAFPPLIEGFPIDVLARFAPIPFADSSLTFVLKSLGLTPGSSLPLLAALTGLYGLWLWRARRAASLLLLSGVAAWCYLTDFFLPAHRGTYNEVQVLNAIALGCFVPRLRSWAARGAAAAILAGWLVLLSLPSAKWIINMPTMVFAAVVTGILIAAARGREARPAAGAGTDGQ